MCALTRSGMQAPALLSLHDKKCEYCGKPAKDLLRMIEEWADSPEGKLDLAAEDLRLLNVSAEEKGKAWGF